MKKAGICIKTKMTGLIVAVLLLLPATQTASAHEGQPPAPHDLWNVWNWDPLILSSMILGTWVYVAGQRELHRRVWPQRPWLTWRTAAFTAGLATIFIALISPLDALSAALFSAHMVQHMLLIVIAPPLLVMGISPGSFLFGLALPIRRELSRWWHKTGWLQSVWHAITQPWIAWTLNVVMVWVWHVPGLYQSALENEALHTLEHLTFVGTSQLFWWAITRPGLRLGRGDPGILALFTMGIQCGLLGALMTFAPSPWYSSYAVTTQAWGLSPLEDQQLAGAIMWIPVGTVYTLAALVLFVIQLAWVERTSHSREPG